jgi:hypothetical protein
MRGTSTLASYYGTFEASDVVTQDSSGVLLDQYGSAEVYVSSLVDVVVKDSTGAVVREFTSGVNENSVEVISKSFTGTDYEDGTTAGNKPTTLGDVLDLWKDSAGAKDFKMLLYGSEVLITTALGSLAQLFFNVKDTAYGAKGDGATDDTTAIQACIDAANAAGGTVLFPPGDYRVTSQLSLGGKVSLLGSGPSGTVISLDHATSKMFVTTATTRDAQRVSELAFRHLQSCSGALWSIENAGTSIIFENCKFGNTTYMDGHCIDAPSGAWSQCVCIGCTFVWSSVCTTVCLMTNCDSRFVSCAFASTAGASTSTCVYGGRTSCTGCEFLLSNTTSGAITCIQSNGSHAGNFMRAASSGTASFVMFSAATFSSYTESASRFTGSLGKMYTGVAGASDLCHASRAVRFVQYDANTDPLTVDMSEYGVIKALVTSTAGWVGNCQIVDTGYTLAPYGALCVMSFRNTSGGAVTFEWSTGFMLATTTFTVANGKTRSFLFVLNNVAGVGNYWMPVADLAGAEA